MNIAQKEQNQGLKGIPIIYYYGCHHCSFFTETGKDCLKNKPYALQIQACIFCPDFKLKKDNPINLLDLPTSRMLDNPGGGISLYNSEVGGPYGHEGELLRRLFVTDEKIKIVLERLDSMKGSKSSPEAIRLRRQLRKMGFNLRKKGDR